MTRRRDWKLKRADWVWLADYDIIERQGGSHHRCVGAWVELAINEAAAILPAVKLSSRTSLMTG